MSSPSFLVKGTWHMVFRPGRAPVQYSPTVSAWFGCTLAPFGVGHSTRHKTPDPLMGAPTLVRTVPGKQPVCTAMPFLQRTALRNSKAIHVKQWSRADRQRLGDWSVGIPRLKPPPRQLCENRPTRGRPTLNSIHRGPTFDAPSKEGSNEIRITSRTLGPRTQPR